MIIKTNPMLFATLAGRSNTFKVTPGQGGTASLSQNKPDLFLSRRKQTWISWQSVIAPNSAAAECEAWQIADALYQTWSKKERNAIRVMITRTRTSTYDFWMKVALPQLMRGLPCPAPVATHVLNSRPPTGYRYWFTLGEIHYWTLDQLAAWPPHLIAYPGPRAAFRGVNAITLTWRNFVNDPGNPPRQGSVWHAHVRADIGPIVDRYLYRFSLRTYITPTIFQSWNITDQIGNIGNWDATATTVWPIHHCDIQPFAETILPDGSPDEATPGYPSMGFDFTGWTAPAAWAAFPRTQGLHRPSRSTTPPAWTTIAAPPAGTHWTDAPAPGPLPYWRTDTPATP